MLFLTNLSHVTFYMSRDMSIEVKEMIWKLLQDGKTIIYVSERLGIPRSTITSFKKHVELYKVLWKTSQYKAENPSGQPVTIGNWKDW